MSGPGRSRTAVAASVVAVLMLGAGVVLYLVLGMRVSGTPGPSTAGPSATATPAVSAAVLPEPEVRRLEAALTTDDPGVAGDALAPAVRTTYLQHPFRLLPTGSSAQIDESTMTVADGTATVGVDVSGGPAAGRWLLVLAQVDSRWLILGTQRP